jgi:hypothetical protein
MIIGMHRSGTSMVTRVLNIAGAYLGEQEELLLVNESNATGHWEYLTVMEIDNALLRLFGGSWTDPPLLPPHWLEESGVQELATQARDFIAAKFAPHSLWALKDPRATLLLPFWRRVAPCPRFVLCIRNPLDVAASLAERDGMEIEHAIALWHLYTLIALRDTQPSERQILFYEEALSDPESHIESLLEFVDAADLWNRPDVRAEIARFMDQGLKHHAHTLQELQQHPRVFTVTKSLYAALVTGDEGTIQENLENAGQTVDMLRALAQANDLRAHLEYDLHHTRLALDNALGVLNTRSHRMADKLSLWLHGKKPRRGAKS